MNDVENDKKVYERSTSYIGHATNKPHEYIKIYKIDIAIELI